MSTFFSKADKGSGTSHFCAPVLEKSSPYPALSGGCSNRQNKMKQAWFLLCVLLVHGHFGHSQPLSPANEENERPHYWSKVT